MKNSVIEILDSKRIDIKNKLSELSLLWSYYPSEIPNPDYATFYENFTKQLNELSKMYLSLIDHHQDLINSESTTTDIRYIDSKDL